MTNAQIETQLLVQSFWQSIKTRNFDSEIVVLAIADLLASVAAKLDLTPDAPKCSLNDRLDCFIERVKERHPEVIAELLGMRSRRASNG